jgi:hypothetical protein
MERGYPRMPHKRSPEKEVKRWLTWIEKRDKLRRRILNSSFFDDELREHVYTDDSIYYHGAHIGEVLTDSRGRGLFQR